MNFFHILTLVPDARTARLTSRGVDVLTNRIGRTLTDVEILNVARKASVLARYESFDDERANANETLRNRANETCSGPACALPCVTCERIENRADGTSNVTPRFELPEDGWIMLAPEGVFDNHRKTGNKTADGKDEEEVITQILDDESLKSLRDTFKLAKQDPNFEGLLIDREHRSNQPNGDSSAAGWIIDVARGGEIGRDDNGLWGKPIWTDSGKKDVESGTFRKISPSWLKKNCAQIDGNPNVLRPLVLSDASLTNLPALTTIKPITTIVS